jgi:hypothetical protein
MMLAARKQRIWLARHRVDFRKQHSGLLAEAYKMSLDPYNGDVVIFIGRNRRRVKVLHADPTGLWISAKLFTLEAMKTNFKFLLEPSCKVISQGELALLLEGSAYTIEKRVGQYTNKVDKHGEYDANSPPS